MFSKNRLLVLLLLVFFFLIGSACLKEPYFPGKDLATLRLHISQAGEEKESSLCTVAREIELLQVTISHHKIKPCSQTVAYSGAGEQTIVFTSLYPGTWKIEVFGLDASMDEIFYGETTQAIGPGETKTVSLSIFPAPGRLQAAIEISQLRAAGVDVSRGGLYYYPDPAANTTEKIALEPDGDWLRGEGLIPEGTYPAEFYIPIKTSYEYKSCPLTITIRAGKSTQLTLEADASVIVQGKIYSTPPTPENFTLTKIEPGIIALSWEAVNTPDLVGYRLYRTNKEGRFVHLIDLPAETLSYSDEITAGLFWNGKLGYAVSSFDRRNLVSFWSEAKYLSLDEL